MNQKILESNIYAIDEQFYLKYQDMKKRHSEWCVQNDWPHHFMK